MLRLAPWSAVFTPNGIRFVPDGDPYYHVLRAQQIAASHAVVWRDAGLDFPIGADVPWPPLFDMLLAGPSWLVGGPHPAPVLVERVAAFVPLVLGLLGILLSAALATELLGAATGATVAWILAVTPSHVHYSVLGRPDQHVLETLLLGSAILLLARLSRSGSTGRRRLVETAMLGSILTASFWSWLGSALHLVTLGGVVAVSYVFASAEDGGPRRAATTLAASSAIAALLLAVTIALAGPPGALHRVSLGGLSAFPVILCGCTALWSALLASMERRWGQTPSRLRRAAEAAGAATLVAALLWTASPGIRDALGRGLDAATRTSGWYSQIREFAPALLAPFISWRGDLSEFLQRFGLAPLFALLGTAELLRRWRSDPEHRPGALTAATLALVFTPLVAFMVRYAYYGALPLALLGALGIERLSRVARHAAASGAKLASTVGVFLLAAPSVPALLPSAWANPSAEAFALAFASIRADSGSLPAKGAVFSNWANGHYARYFSGLPVIASPFGTEGGVGAMEDFAAFYLTADPAVAGALLSRRGVRWLAIGNPTGDVLDAVALARPPHPPVTIAGDRRRGYFIHCEPEYDELVASRLYHRSGSENAIDHDALEHFRLVADIGAGGQEPMLRLFEVVEGADLRVTGARPGSRVVARTVVATPQGTFPWVVGAAADALGRARLRLPYATGRNGAVSASAYLVTGTTTAALVTATEEQIRLGTSLDLNLPPR